MVPFGHDRARTAENLRMAAGLERGSKIVEVRPAQSAAPQRQPRVLCVAPAWNEGERITRVVNSVRPGLVDSLLVVDDGSTDDTADRAEAAGAQVLRLDGNRGVGAAIRSGIDHALANDFDV